MPPGYRKLAVRSPSKSSSRRLGSYGNGRRLVGRAQHPALDPLRVLGARRAALVRHRLAGHLLVAAAGARRVRVGRRDEAPAVAERVGRPRPLRRCCESAAPYCAVSRGRRNEAGLKQSRHWSQSSQSSARVPGMTRCAFAPAVEGETPRLCARAPRTRSARARRSARASARRRASSTAGSQASGRDTRAPALRPPRRGTPRRCRAPTSPRSGARAPDRAARGGAGCGGPRRAARGCPRRGRAESRARGRPSRRASRRARPAWPWTRGSPAAARARRRLRRTPARPRSRRSGPPSRRTAPARPRAPAARRCSNTKPGGLLSRSATRDEIGRVGTCSGARPSSTTLRWPKCDSGVGPVCVHSQPRKGTRSGRAGSRLRALALADAALGLAPERRREPLGVVVDREEVQPGAPAREVAGVRGRVGAFAAEDRQPVQEGVRRERRVHVQVAEQDLLRRRRARLLRDLRARAPRERHGGAGPARCGALRPASLRLRGAAERREQREPGRHANANEIRTTAAYDV